MKIKTTIAALALAPLALTACGGALPCDGLTASQQDREAAANGYDVEREDSRGNECELNPDGTSWSVDH